MDVRPVPPELVRAAAAFVAAQQARPEHHIAYLDHEPAVIASELAGLEPAGLEATLVATEGDEVIGLLAAEWDTGPPRIWWHGPFAAPGERWDEVADALYATARALPPAALDQEELGPDGRNAGVAAFAARHGFAREVGSAVLRRDLADLADLVPAADQDTGPPVRPATAEDRAQVAALHDRLFPATHTPGDRLDQGEGRHVLVVGEPAVRGYVAVERQATGDGYIDFLGVRPEDRGSGLGRRLVATACARLRDAEGCRAVHLTVRADNVAARRLYDRLGFAEERIIVPWRRGFTLATGA